MSSRNLTAWLCSATLLSLAGAQVNAEPLFEDHAILTVTLSGPVLRTIKDRGDRAESPFVLTVDGVNIDVKVKIRGNSRVLLCDFPPLRLNFPATGTADTTFAGQDKLKLVTHCDSGSRSTNSMLREYVAYRILNLLSDVSYRVRLLRIQYEDSKSSSSKFGIGVPQFAFLIESTDALAARLGGTPIEIPGVSLASLNDRQEALVYIFHYLIGNIDWSLVMSTVDDKCCHNGDLFDVGEWRYIVPFDFDLSNFVDARYRLTGSASLQKVRYRKYQGHCMPHAALRDGLREIKAKREDILALIEELPDMKPQATARSVRYLQEFFDKAEDEEKLLDSFEKRCK